ncbi:MAG: hypothetical protein ACYTFG_13585, partial [Planctomycetota bacterium]
MRPPGNYSDDGSAGRRLGGELPRALIYIALMILFCPKSLTYGGEIELKITSPLRFGEEAALHYRPGAWIPLFLSASNRGATDRKLRLSAASRGLEGSDASVFGLEVRLPSSSNKVIPFYVSAPGDSTSLELTVKEESLLERSSVPLHSIRDDEMVALLADPRGPAKAFFSHRGLCGGRSHVFPARSTQIPDRPEGFEPFDWIFIGATGDLSPAQVDALCEWVDRGGNALVFPAPGANPELLGKLYPHAGLETVSVQVSRDRSFPGLADLPIAITVTAAGGGEILAEIEGRPLLRRARYGAGRVLFFAADPTKPPLKDWDARGAFLSPYLEGGRRSNSSVLADRCAGEIGEIGCEPTMVPVALFLSLWAVVLSPLGFLVFRALPSWRLGLAFFLVLSALFILIAALWVGTSLEGGGLARRTFAVLHGRHGAEACLAETYRATAYCSPRDVNVHGDSGELVAPVHMPLSNHRPSHEVAVGRAPALTALSTPAGGLVFSRHLEKAPIPSPHIEFVLGSWSEASVRGTNPTDLDFTEMAALFGHAVYGSMGLPPRGEVKSTWSLFTSTPTRDLAKFGIRYEQEVGCHWEHSGTAGRGEISREIVQSHPRGAWFDEGRNRVLFRGTLCGRWTASGLEEAGGATRGITFCDIVGSNPEGVIHLPPGVLAPHWLTSRFVPLVAGGKDEPRLEGGSVVIPSGAEAVVEFILPVTPRVLEDLELNLGLLYASGSEDDI